MIKSVHTINAAPADASKTGPAVQAETTQRASIIATIAGATVGPVGTLYLEASNQPADPGGNEPPSGSWATVDSVAFAANGTDGVTVPGCAYRWLRARWAYTSGTAGTINVYMQANG